jgi:hypothetical protein
LLRPQHHPLQTETDLTDRYQEQETEPRQTPQTEAHPVNGKTREPVVDVPL